MHDSTNSQKNNQELLNTVYVKSVGNQKQVIIGVNHATQLVFEKTLENGRQTIKRLTTLFKILKSMHGLIYCYWNGIHGQPFQSLRK